MTIANYITLSRILGVFLILAFVPFHDYMSQLVVVALFMVICFTDFLDGWVARRFDMVTDLGKVLDPLADKILILVFLPLIDMQVINSWPVFVILCREFAIMGLRVYAAKMGWIISASLSGKLKTSFTLLTCGILLCRVPIALLPDATYSFLTPLAVLQQWVLGWPLWVVDGFIWGMVILTLVSFLDYLGKLFRLMKTS